MSLLSRDEVARYALAHRRIFESMCDEEGCGKLIAPGEMCVVLRWKRRTDGLTFLGCIPLRIRCLTCQLEKNPPKEEVKVKGAPRGAKKLSQQEASKLSINPIVRRAAISLLKRLGPLPAADMLLKLRKKKAIRDLKKSEITRTLRGLKKLKVLKFRAKTWTIVQPKLKKDRKVRKNKSKKVVAKR